MADESVAELNQRFGSGTKNLEADVVGELQSIMRIHQLSVQDTFFKWDAYTMKMGMDDIKPTIDTIRAFKQQVQDELERSNRSQVHIKTERRAGAAPRAGKGDMFSGMLDGISTPGPGRTKMTPKRTPAVSRVKAEPASSPLKVEDQLNAMGAIPPSSFNDRPNPGEVLEILNEQLDAAEPPISPFSESRIKLTAASDQKKLGYKPLAMKLSEASEILDDRIDDFVGLVMEHHNLEDSAFGSPASQGTTEIVAKAPGEWATACASHSISANSPATNSFPAKSSPSAASTPPAGNSPSTKSSPSPPSQRRLLPSTLTIHLDRLRGGPDAMESDHPPLPLSILFASGPYTADDNLDFEPLHTLCSEAADTFADALILTGPFIDVDHLLIASGDFDLPAEATYDPDTATMSTVFKYLISPALNRLVASNPSITILLIPSVRDVLDKHVSWPQDAFPRRELGLPKTARVVGNPMTLSVNEMVLGISSQDVLFELRAEELVGGGRGRKRLPKTGTGRGDGGAMLDVSYLKLGEMVNVRPDVLVVPSALPPFAKVVESVLVLNPGCLSKKKGAGTYAKMTLYPPTQKDLASDGMVAHRIFERARVEITRI
ncbi:DNA-directed DNA polymerase alpha subunit pol12 [Collariella sp. IMI 366227]|nr:DNA-directed DNA polymerase alpha subunit pol12 [Collariella sp. IMI 366227]